MFLKLCGAGLVSSQIGIGSKPYPLSLRIPALLTRMVIPPNASKADLITAAPSVTDEVFTTAFPPATRSKPWQRVSSPSRTVRASRHHEKRTLRDLVHNLLCRGGVEIIHHNIRSP